MTAKIRLLPSGREFFAGPHETLLEAALRAGVALRYSCNSGTCGECRARLLSGTLEAERFHEFRFAPEDRAAGQFLTCCNVAAGDLEIEAPEVGPEEISQQRIPAQVAKVELPDPDVMVVHLRTPRSKTLRFLAGQHALLEIEGLAPRNKSIASCPCNAMNLQFHVRRTEKDPFAEFCFSRLKPGTQVSVIGPAGRFTFDDNATRPVIFLAYDTGFAPIKSLIEHAISLEFDLPMHLYWVAPRGAGHYLANYCRAWGDALSDFTFTLMEAMGEAPGPAAEHGLSLGARRIVADHPDISRYDVYANGPEGGTPILSLLREYGLPPAQLHIDSLQRFS